MDMLIEDYLDTKKSSNVLILFYNLLHLLSENRVARNVGFMDMI